jgi:hypothetical protein
MGDRYLQKIMVLSRTPGLHLARMEDLLCRIKAKLPELESFVTEIEEHWGEEDGVYWFYQAGDDQTEWADDMRTSYTNFPLLSTVIWYNARGQFHEARGCGS